MQQYQLMENEKYRWSYMTDEQLARRLKKITNPVKLNCFIDMAGMRGNGYLLDLAEERRVDLGLIDRAKFVGRHEVSIKGVADAAQALVKVKKQVAEKWDEVKEKEIDERYLEF